MKVGGTRFKIIFLGLIFTALAVRVAAQAVQLQIHDAGKLRDLAEDQYLRQIQLPPRRGRLLDRLGHELGATAEFDSVYCNPRQLQHVPGGAERLALALGTDKRDLEKAITARRAFAWVKRGAASKEAARALGLGIPGVGVRKEPRRVYPREDTGGTVIGHTDIDGRGIEGVEQAFDGYLRGSGSKVQSMKDAAGRELLFGGLVDGAATAGKDVMLSLDKYLMWVTEKALKTAVDTWKAKGATAVMIDPKTGEILAMASVPTYDPSHPGDAIARGARNRAVTDQMEPGSTMKTFTMLAALESGKVAPTRMVDCQMGRKLKIGKYEIGDSHPEGVLSAAEVYQKSSNIGTVKIATWTGKEVVHDMFTRFGFGQKTGVGLRGEVRGALHPLSKWGPIEFATNSYGQGIAVTPLQMAVAYAAIASGGIYRTPRLGIKVFHADGHDEPLPLADGVRSERRVVSEKTAKAMLDIMKAVATEAGTARRAAIDGYTVAGKTGTAKKAGAGRYLDKWIGSFIGIVPAVNPRFVLGVWVDEPEPEHKGGLVAAPAWREIAEKTLKYLAVQTTEPILSETKKSGPNPEGGARVAAAILASRDDAEDEGSGIEEVVLGTEEGTDEIAVVPDAQDEGVDKDLVALPRFEGMSVAEAVRAARRAGVDLVLEGSGLAVGQSLTPGPVPRGAVCRVSFKPRG